MPESDILKIAVAETSVIIRSGLAVVLKRIQGMKLLPLEVSTPEELADCLRLHKPEILIINPAFPGFYDVKKIKENTADFNMKCVALLCSMGDTALLKDYDDTCSLYETPEVLKEKLNQLLNVEEEIEESLTGQDVLSGREKEIVTCVVRGMTNKEIADLLYLSTHTVITHRRNIARKLQIHSSAGLTIYAIVNKLVELQDIKGYL